MQDELQKRIVHLEEIYTHQQQYINQLNDALVEFRREFDQLKRTVELQRSQIEWLTENQSQDGPANEKPPHY